MRLASLRAGAWFRTRLTRRIGVVIHHGTSGGVQVELEALPSQEGGRATESKHIAGDVLVDPAPSEAAAA